MSFIPLPCVCGGTGQTCFGSTCLVCHGDGLEMVSVPTAQAHLDFLELDIANTEAEDPSNDLLPEMIKEAAAVKAALAKFKDGWREGGC